MHRLLGRPVRAIKTLPEPVRWLAIPVALAICTALVLAEDNAPWSPALTMPHPDAEAALYCQSLMKALPDNLEGHSKVTPDPSPNVAYWSSSPRTVLRCGVPRPKSLNIEANQRKESPSVNNVQWYDESDGHGGYRFTTTLRKAYVEVDSPAGAYPNLVDPLSPISYLVNSTIPDKYGRLNATDDDAV
ncbi:DUF3515 domain-containing protein [Kitasatospora acidiphila]|uniref:DUF3515 domain-containing protein n=1 Tax=Kitasatospora acidiphila TaxID=2567942 RepID=A0A540W8S6_9ACTN|nr:DUF3515 domain-containing protein [Kitasatospora acidiphila]